MTSVVFTEIFCWFVNENWKKTTSFFCQWIKLSHSLNFLVKLKSFLRLCVGHIGVNRGKIEVYPGVSHGGKYRRHIKWEKMSWNLGCDYETVTGDGDEIGVKLGSNTMARNLNFRVKSTVKWRVIKWSFKRCWFRIKGWKFYYRVIPFCSAGIVHLILAFFGANFPFRLRGMHFTTSWVGLNFLSRHLTLHVDPPLDVVSQSIFIAVGSILKYENAFPHRVSA